MKKIFKGNPEYCPITSQTFMWNPLTLNYFSSSACFVVVVDSPKSFKEKTLQ